MASTLLQTGVVVGAAIKDVEIDILGSYIAVFLPAASNFSSSTRGPLRCTSRGRTRSTAKKKRKETSGLAREKSGKEKETLSRAPLLQVKAHKPAVAHREPYPRKRRKRKGGKSKLFFKERRETHNNHNASVPPSTERRKGGREFPQTASSPAPPSPSHTSPNLFARKKTGGGEKRGLEKTLRGSLSRLSREVFVPRLPP